MLLSYDNSIPITDDVTWSKTGSAAGNVTVSGATTANNFAEV